MKIERTILSIVGLVAIALAYLTGNFYFLLLAIVVFFIGLYAMGARRTSQRNSADRSSSMRKNSREPESKLSVLEDYPDLTGQYCIRNSRNSHSLRAWSVSRNLLASSFITPIASFESV